MKTILKSVNMVNPLNEDVIKTDIFIENGLISSMENQSGDNETAENNAERIDSIDCDGFFAAPGLIDVHVHFRDPGLTYKEDIGSGSKAAAFGGFTTVCGMANTIPAVDSVDTLLYVDHKGIEKGYVNYLSVGAMSKGLKGKELTDIFALDKAVTRSKEMSGHGIIALSDDGVTLKDNDLMSEACKVCKSLDLLIMDHPESETEMVFRDIELSKKYGTKIHLQHISKKESVDLIRQAKADKLNISAEAAPHHFYLNEDIISKFKTNAKMNPPLATEKDRKAVLEGLIDDTIDIISTDHAPHTTEEKNTQFEKAPFGIIGLETSFPVSYTVLVESKMMSLNKLINKMSTKPAEILGVKRGLINPGSAADITILDIENEYEIDKNRFASKARNTPFDGMSVRGRVIMTIKDGIITFKR